MTNPILTAIGRNGQLELYSNKICIKRKGFSAFFHHGFKGDKEISISAITSIQFKNAGVFFPGYIQFAYMGSQEGKSGLHEAWWDENTVMFLSNHQAMFQRVKDELERRMMGVSTPVSRESPADEIIKLADLRDRGILTEEEFQEQKKKVLGLASATSAQSGIATESLQRSLPVGSDDIPSETSVKATSSTNDLLSCPNCSHQFRVGMDVKVICGKCNAKYYVKHDKNNEISLVPR